MVHGGFFVGRGIGAAASALVLVCCGGCQPAASTTSPTPTIVATGPDIEPTYECVPSVASAGESTPSPTPTVCSRETYLRQEALNAAYVEAEGQLQKFHEAEALLAQGDAAGQEPLRGVTTREIYDEVAGQYATDLAEGYRFEGSDIALRSVYRYPDRAPRSVVALQACTDFRNTVLMKKSKVVRPGRTVVRALSFQRVDGVLLVSNIDVLDEPC